MMKQVVALSLFVFITMQAFAQQFTVVSYDANNNDSSFYEIRRMPDGSYWVGGKNGVLYRYGTDGSFTPIAYPNAGTNIYQIEALSSTRYLVCADHGYIYFYDVTHDSWERKRLKGFNKKGFYSAVVIDSLTAYMCGGKTRICVGKPDIPFGFVLKTTDGGQTWKKVYRATAAMMWDIDYDAGTREVLINKYNLLSGTRIVRIAADNAGHRAKSKRYKCLAHEYLPELDMPAGGRTYKHWKTGRFYEGKQRTLTNTKYMLWDVVQAGERVVWCCSYGKLLVRGKAGEQPEMISTPSKLPLYTLETNGPNTILVAGTNKTLLIVKF